MRRCRIYFVFYIGPLSKKTVFQSFARQRAGEMRPSECPSNRRKPVCFRESAGQSGRPGPFGSPVLTKFATRVRVLHRRDQLRASKILQERAFQNEKMEFIWNTVPTEIVGDAAGKVIGVKTQNTVTGAEDYLTTDGVFIFVGHIPNNDLLKEKFELDEDGHLVTDRYTRTNIPGIFAGGEIQDKVFKQVATSVGQGCAAAMQTTRWLEEFESHGVIDLTADPRQFPQPKNLAPAY